VCYTNRLLLLLSVIVFFCLLCVSDAARGSETREKSTKTERVVHYNAAEVRQYMKKRRAEQRLKRCKETEARANAEADRERRLQELMRRQHETAAAASATAKRRRTASLQQVACIRRRIFMPAVVSRENAWKCRFHCLKAAGTRENGVAIVKVYKNALWMVVL